MHFTASSEPKEIADEAEEEERQKMEPKVFDEVIKWFLLVLYLKVCFHTI